RRRDRQGAGQPLEQPRRAFFAPGHLLLGQAGEPRYLLDEFVVDQRPSGELLDDAPGDLRAAGRVLARDRHERLQGEGRRRFWRRSPMFNTGIPPSVGTRMIMLFEVLSSRSTSKYCRVS